MIGARTTVTLHNLWDHDSFLVLCDSDPGLPARGVITGKR